MIRDKDGFTLIEVLVALAIAGLIGSALAGLSSFFARLETRVEAREAAMREVLAFRRLLQTSVENGFPVGVADPESALRNDATRFLILSRGPAGLTASEPQKMIFHVVRIGNEAALEVTWRDEETNSSETEIVLRGADKIAFSYLDRQSGKPVWYSTWSDPTRLPVVVLAQIDIEELGGPIDIIARPALRFPEACLALPRHPQCREVGS